MKNGSERNVGNSRNGHNTRTTRGASRNGSVKL